MNRRLSQTATKMSEQKQKQQEKENFRVSSSKLKHELRDMLKLRQDIEKGRMNNDLI